MTELNSVDKRIGFAEIDHLAERFGLRRMRLVEAGAAGDIGLYFRFDGFISDLPNPAPGNRLQMRPYNGYLQVTRASLDEIYERRVAYYVKEAHIPSDEKLVYVELPALSATVAKPLHLELHDLHAIGDDVRNFAQRETACVPSESKEQRQARRYRMCVDAGLKMPRDTYARLPKGVGALAKKEGIERQSFTEDVKGHIGRVFGR